MQSILLLSSKEAHWSCQFWLQRETSNLGLQQPKLCLSQTEIYLGWAGVGWGEKNNCAETFPKAQRQKHSWCESSRGSLHNCPPEMQPLVLSAAQDINTGAACLSLELRGTAGGVSHLSEHILPRYFWSPRVVFADRFVATCSLQFRITFWLTEEQASISSLLCWFCNQCSFNDPLLLYQK